MERETATAVVQQLNEWGVGSAVISRGQCRAGVRVPLPDGREARWGMDGTAALGAVVLRDGVLVGFVSPVLGSAAAGAAAIAWAIAKGDYGAAEVASCDMRRTAPPPPGSLAWTGNRRPLRDRLVSRLVARLPRIS